MHTDTDRQTDSETDTRSHVHVRPTTTVPVGNAVVHGACGMDANSPTKFTSPDPQAPYTIAGGTRNLLARLEPQKCVRIYPQASFLPADSLVKQTAVHRCIHQGQWSNLSLVVQLIN